LPNVSLAQRFDRGTRPEEQHRPRALPTGASRSIRDFHSSISIMRVSRVNFFLVSAPLRIFFSLCIPNLPSSGVRGFFKFCIGLLALIVPLCFFALQIFLDESVLLLPPVEFSFFPIPRCRVAATFLLPALTHKWEGPLDCPFDLNPA